MQLSINFEETQLCQAVATECLPHTCETMGPILYSAQPGPVSYKNLTLTKDLYV